MAKKLIILTKKSSLLFSLYAFILDITLQVQQYFQFLEKKEEVSSFVLCFEHFFIGFFCCSLVGCIIVLGCTSSSNRWESTPPPLPTKPLVLN
jgi:hypothetical protein